MNSMTPTAGGRVAKKRKAQAAKKAKEVSPPLTTEEKEEFNPPRAGKYGRRPLVGDNLKAQTVTTVGLGGLKVTTNGRDHYRQH